MDFKWIVKGIEENNRLRSRNQASLSALPVSRRTPIEQVILLPAGKYWTARYRIIAVRDPPRTGLQHFQAIRREENPQICLSDAVDLCSLMDTQMLYITVV